MRSKLSVATERYFLVFHTSCFSNPSFFFFVALLQFNKLKKRTLSEKENLIHLHFPRLLCNKFQIIIRPLATAAAGETLPLPEEKALEEKDAMQGNAILPRTK